MRTSCLAAIRRKLLFLLIAVLSVTYLNAQTCTGFISGTYTINSAQPTAGPNFQSFTDAIAALQCGINGPVVFNVEPGSGPYNEQIIIPSIAGASATNTITFNGNGATLRANPTNAARHIIRLNGADYVTIDNLNIVGQNATYGWGIHLINGTDHNTISNCTIDISAVTNQTSSNSVGITVSGSTSSLGNGTSAHNNTIRNNTILGGYQGIINFGTSSSLNLGNKIINNIIKDFYAVGIDLSYNDGLEVSFNDISRPNRTVVTTFTGIELGRGTIRSKVNGNRVHDTHTKASTVTGNAGIAYGIYLNDADATPGDENKITNNLIYNFNHNSGTIYGLYNVGANGAHYFHNTVVLDHAAASGITRGFYQTSAASNLQFKNNIVYITRGGTGVKYCLYVASATNLVSDNNVLYNASTEGTNGIGYWGTTPYATLTNWKTANSNAYDQQSISADPQFQNPAVGDYEPLQPSIEDMGSNVGVDKDIAGNPRTVTSPDPGAYEFNFSKCSGTPIGGTAVSSLLNVCDESFALSLSGNSKSEGIVYQWQTSPDNTTWTDVFDATGNGFVTTQMTNTYYRALVTCANSNITVPSASVMVTSAPLISGTFTIDNRVATGGTNFQSFKEAYNSLKCGIDGPVVFNVASGSGPYEEQLILPPVRGASATNTITFNGNGNTIAYLSKNTNERAVIKLDGADYVTLNNLTITARGTSVGDFGYGIQLINNADFNTINNCTININKTSSFTEFAGIVVSSSATSATNAGDAFCDDNTFSNNTINGGFYGLTLVGSRDQANGRNKIVNNTINDFYQYGIYVSGSFSTLIERNTISRPARTSVAAFYGIYFTNRNTKATITRNTITNPFGSVPESNIPFYGINFTAVEGQATLESIVSNNLIHNLTGRGDVYGIYNNGSGSVWYYHNTISMDGSAAAGTASAVTRGVYQTGASPGLEFKNNIITISRGGLSNKIAIYLSTEASSIVSDKNNFFISSTTGARNIGFYSSPRSTLASWQAATSLDQQSFSLNPIYKDSTTGDFKPQNPALDNQGVPVDVSNDILNDARSATTPDIGAFEFTPEPCSGAPIAGKATVSENPVCGSTPVMLSVRENIYALGQKFQWQSSLSETGPYDDLGNVLDVPDTLIISPDNPMYYRLAISCGGQTSYSTPIQLNIAYPLSAGIYTINKNAPASASNFTSFKAAKDAMACSITGPVVFNVVPGSGPYEEQLILGTINGTSEINTITFNGNGNTIRFSSNSDDERAVIKLNGTKHTTFNNLVIDATGAGTYGYGVQFINDADSNVLRNSTITLSKTSTSVNHGGIIINASATAAVTTGATLCNNNTLENNTINGGYYGITLVGGPSSYVDGNKIINNKIFDFYEYGIYLENTSNTLVEGNELARPTRINSGTAQVIYAKNGSEGLFISKNRIHNAFGAQVTAINTFYGISFSNVDAPTHNVNTVVNNLIYNINGNGAIYGINNAGSDNVVYYHNTVSLDVASSTTTDNTYGFFQNNDAEGIELKNNLITVTRGGTGNKFGLYFETTATKFTSDNNDVFVSGLTSFFGYFASANLATLEAWKTTSGRDLTSAAIDPVYSNPATGNFKPASPALDNRGANVNIATDIEGVARNTSAPDIGAFEFNVPPCTTPPVAGITKATPSSGICMGTPVLLSLEGNTFGSGMSFQWEYASDAGGPYLPLGAPKLFPDTLIEASTTLYYRAAVTCSGNTVYSPAVLVSVNPAFLTGVYTIDPAKPVSSTNFQSFTTAAAALYCGITGPVTFMVAPGTYTEQVLMKKVPGATATSRVTFQGVDGDQNAVTLTYAAISNSRNYVLKLDSASYITFKDMTITATSSTYGRVIELANTASNDSLVNLAINAPVYRSKETAVVGIYAEKLRGGNHVIKGNTIVNGSNGIYLSGPSGTMKSARNVIDSNTISGTYNHGIFLDYTSRIKVTNNKVSATAPLHNFFYGIYSGYADSAYQIVGNTINLTNTSGTMHGIYSYYNIATAQERGRVANNTILVTGNNTSMVYGLYNYYSSYSNTVNNVISINTSGANSYGIYSFHGERNNFYNNSVNSTSTSTSNNYAGYFYHASSTTTIRNNIFSHEGGGIPFYAFNPNYTFSDFNMLYTNGGTLVQVGQPVPINYSNLQAWRNAYSWDPNSIVYKPAFVSETDLQPNVADPHVWAIHGRGVQIPELDYDFNNQPRPTTLQAGVPDLGAFEFVPTVEPPVLTAIPAAPVAGGTQTFMFGTDTVSKITWAPSTPVPTSISMKRYSGVTPPGLTSSTPHMYYYTDVQTTGATTMNFSKKDFYVYSWQGHIKHQYQIKLGRTDDSGNWEIGTSSTVDSLANVITEENLSKLYQFTGLADVNAVPPPAPVFTRQVDSSNMGKRFWVGYAYNYEYVEGNNQEMVLYLNTGAEPATVTVRVNGTNWVRTYNIPAFTAFTSDKLPKFGLNDSRLLEEGKSAKGISIESNTPIVAYAHFYHSTNSAATMLLPVGTYGYEYYTLNSKQVFLNRASHSSFLVVADHDNTVVEITPANPTVGGRAANMPFTVTLNRGEVYQVLGAYINTTSGYDLTGSKIKSIPNADGKCYPVAVFAGSSNTRLNCGAGETGFSADMLFQQVLPYQAWGTRYLTAPTSIASSARNVQTNIYRVMVKDPTTVVQLNGVQLGNLINNRYYEFINNTANYIQADKPIMVAQYMLSAGSSCAIRTSDNDGDPEVFYLSPLEQAIKSAVFYRNNLSAVPINYLTLSIPTNGLASLTIDGSNTFDNVYDHPNLPGYSVVVKRWGNGAGQSTIKSDSAFIGIVYGIGYKESYGYNLGMLVKSLNALPTITNTLSTTSGPSEYTCVNAPFKASVFLPVMATKLTWNFSQVNGITPNADVTQNNPVPVETVVINNNTYYKYVLNQEYTFNTTGTYEIPISFTNPDLDGCDNTRETILTVKVVAAPSSDFTVSYTNCIGDQAQFTGTAGTGVTVNKWEWSFGDGGTATTSNPTHQYTADGSYEVNLKLLTPDGCVGEAKKNVLVNARPTVAVVSDNLASCAGTTVKLAVKDPVAGVTYNWYDAATGGTLRGSGEELTVTVNGSTEYFVEATNNGCASSARQQVRVTQLSGLTTPVVMVDSVGGNLVRFTWSAVPNATGYEVWTSRNPVWETPSSGATGLVHTVTGLQSLDSVRLMVRAKGGCGDVQSVAVTGRALMEQIFIPNTFSPNGDGLNDVLQVYGGAIKEMQFMIFNQWGERIHESRDMRRAWDGTSKGKLQPAGVYMYVSKLILNDGTVIQKKGSINLVR